MAKNGKKDGARKGKVKARTQTYSPRNKRFTKVDAKTGKFIDQMAKRGKKFKGVKVK